MLIEMIVESWALTDISFFFLNLQQKEVGFRVVDVVWLKHRRMSACPVHKTQAHLMVSLSLSDINWEVILMNFQHCLFDLHTHTHTEILFLVN